MRKRWIPVFRGGLLGGALLAALAGPSAAQAAFPGANGPIAYVCDYGAFSQTHNPHEICTITPGQSLDRLTTNDAADLNPDFSASGMKIAFEEDGDIYRMSADGTGRKRLTKSSAPESDPAWAPSGKQIVFVKNPLTKPKMVVIRASDGTVLRTLGTGLEPQWSPNGKKIAFAKRDHIWCVGVDCVSGYGIYAEKASDGSGRTALTSTTQYADGTACDPTDGCPETNGNPDWRPDGTEIAWDIFDSDASTGYAYEMTAGGGGKALLVAYGAVGGGCPQHPAFSPDATELVFSDGTYCDTGGNPPSVFVRGVGGGSPQNIAAGYEPDWGPAP